MQQVQQNTATFKLASFERPSEIDNSDIEGEHPGQLKPNLIVRIFLIQYSKASSRFHNDT